MSVQDELEVKGKCEHELKTDPSSWPNCAQLYFMLD